LTSLEKSKYSASLRFESFFDPTLPDVSKGMKENFTVVFQQKAEQDNAFLNYKKDSRGMLEINSLSNTKTTESRRLDDKKKLRLLSILR
jgi:hypothetical protein